MMLKMGINIYKTKSGSYIMDRAGLSVDEHTSDDAGILYASNGKSYHKFSSDQALDWYDINILEGLGIVGIKIFFDRL